MRASLANQHRYSIMRRPFLLPYDRQLHQLACYMASFRCPRAQLHQLLANSKQPQKLAAIDFSATFDQKSKARRHQYSALSTKVSEQILTQIAWYLVATDFALRLWLAALSALLAAAFETQIVCYSPDIGRNSPRRGSRF